MENEDHSVSHGDSGAIAGFVTRKRRLTLPLSLVHRAVRFVNEVFEAAVLPWIDIGEAYAE
jgi:hypothetical protein